MQSQHRLLYGPLEAARLHLWSVCSSPDEQVIVDAAKGYGELHHSFWLMRQEVDRARAGIADADARIVRAIEDHVVYSTALRVAREAEAAARMALSRVHDNEQLRTAVHEPGGLFELELAVTDAVHELIGTTGEQFAYSYVETKELPVWQEMVAAAVAKA